MQGRAKERGKGGDNSKCQESAEVGCGATLVKWQLVVVQTFNGTTKRDKQKGGLPCLLSSLFLPWWLLCPRPLLVMLLLLLQS
jgi:hypothetical protein